MQVYFLIITEHASSGARKAKLHARLA